MTIYYPRPVVLDELGTSLVYWDENVVPNAYALAAGGTIRLTADQIANVTNGSPESLAILANTGATYIGPAPDYRNIDANGSRLNWRKSLGVSRKARQRFWRPIWERNVQRRYSPATTFWPNIGSVVYIDPQLAVGGAGTFADPRNTTPAGAANTTWLFKEGSVYNGRINDGGNANILFGTYSALDGSRVTDPARIATINATGSGFTHGINITSNPTGSVVAVSGLRVVGVRNVAGAILGIFVSSVATPASHTTVVEHCAIEDSFGISCGAAIDVRSKTSIVRFNKTSGPNDQIFLAPTNTGATIEVYGNETLIPAATTWDGPDGIQLSMSGTNTLTYCLIADNWIDHRANCKQGILRSNGTKQATDRARITRNFLWGIDPSSTAELGSGDASQVAWNWDGYGLEVVSNYIDGWRAWGSVQSTSANIGVLAGNLCFIDHPTTQVLNGWMIGAGTSSDDFGVYCNNTFITVYPNSTLAMFSAGNSATTKNNLFLGPWTTGLKLHHSPTQVENYNWFYGVTNPVVNAANAAVALGVNSSSGVNPKMLNYWVPEDDSPLISAGLVFNGSFGQPFWFEDLFGARSSNSLNATTTAPTVGAIQESVDITV